MPLRGKCSCVWYSILFSDAVCAGSIAGSILWVLLVLSVLQCSRKWCLKYCAYWEYEHEGPNTASTGSMMSSTQPRPQAVYAVQTSEMVGVLRVSRVLNP